MGDLYGSQTSGLWVPVFLQSLTLVIGGGIGYEGPTKCTDGYICIAISRWFSQCYSAPPLGGKTCISGGLLDSDVASIGVFVVLAIQAFLAMVLTFWTGKRVAGQTRSCIVKFVLFIIDIQTLNGIGLVTNAIVHWQTTGLYQLRLIYDTVTLVGASIWPGMITTSNDTHRTKSRIISILAFTTLYLIFSVLFGVRLRLWDAYLPGQCYETGIMNVEGWSHPLFETVYLGIVTPILIILILASLFLISPLGHCPDTRGPVIAFTQGALHLFSIAILRSTRQNFLIMDETENDISLGQVLVMVLFLSIPLQFYKLGNEFLPNYKPYTPPTLPPA